MVPAVEYSLEGGSVTDNGSSFLGTGKYALQYLSVPYNSIIALHLFHLRKTGPDFDILIDAKISQDGYPTISDPQGFNSINFGWRLGFGLSVAKNAGIDFHYLYGLTNIFDDLNGIEFSNRVFQIGFFYSFKNTPILQF
jgi:hypothetical protein